VRPPRVVEDDKKMVDALKHRGEGVTKKHKLK
jgi:hypothetical protein